VVALVDANAFGSARQIDLAHEHLPRFDVLAIARVGRAATTATYVAARFRRRSGARVVPVVARGIERSRIEVVHTDLLRLSGNALKGQLWPLATAQRREALWFASLRRDLGVATFVAALMRERAIGGDAWRIASIAE
jgi:hypothetical protein